MSQRPLNVGLIGDGGSAFIVHPQARAVHLDGTRRVVAAALSSNPKKALEAAAKWAYPVRGYECYDAMFAAQKDLPAELRLDYVVIVTPNHVHFDPAAKAMKAGVAVFCEKPLTLNLAEAAALVKLQRKTGVPFAVAHTYLGHWTSRFSRYIVRSGLLGEIRWVDSYYLQGWLATVATNRWVDRKRKQSRFVDPSQDRSGETDFIHRIEAISYASEDTLIALLRDCLKAAFGQCSSEARVLLRLVYLHELSQREVVKMLGWNEAKVSRFLSKAMGEIEKHTLTKVKKQDPWLELTWQDFVELCETHQIGFM